MGSNDDKKIVSSPVLGYIAHPGGLGCAFFEKMWEHHDKIAQIDALTGTEESYVSLMQRCVRTALKMRSKGIKPDDIINIRSINNMDICVPYIASLFLGAIPSSIDPTFSLEDTVHLLNQIKPKMIFVDPKSVKNVEEALEEASFDIEIVVFGNTPNFTPFEEFLEEHPEEDDFKPVPVKSLRDTAVIAFSRGTTSGLPKGVCLNHYGLILTCYQTGKLLHMTKTLSFSSFLSISTINLVLTTMLYGGCRIVVPKFDPQEFWQLLTVYKPTTIFLSTSYVKTLIKMGRSQSAKLNLKMIVLSGGKIIKDEMQIFQQMVPEAHVVLGYAQTELNGFAILFDVLSNLEERAWSKEKLTSSGTALPGFSMKIVNTQQELLGPNEIGELRIKSDIVMNGYYNIDSTSSWDSEGWLKTGDTAYYDEDSCFYIIDRNSDMFNSESNHVTPVGVETAFLQNGEHL